MYSNTFLKNLFLLLLVLFNFSACRLLFPPQKAPPQEGLADKPVVDKELKVGLFISGAGANTFATLPFLELMQSQNIRFTMMGGTGWGAWLTGFYAKNQNIDELKWNLLKLKEQGVFGTKWFGNKKKRIKILKAITEEFLSSSLSVNFACPVLGRTSFNTLFLSGRRGASSVLNCLQGLPPLFFSFFKKRGRGSVFSAGPLLEHIHQQVDVIIWIKPSLSLKPLRRDPAFYLFWKELASYLSRKKETLSKKEGVIVLETKANAFSVGDFSHLSSIIKTPVLLSEQNKLNRFLKKNKGGE